MQTQQSLFESELKKLINIEIERLKEALAFNNFTEMGQFKFVMGSIAGLRVIEEFANEARDKSNQRSR
jgi:hypothetical protein